MSDPWMATTIYEILSGAVARDYERVCNLTVAIAEERGNSGILGLCYCLAEMVMKFGLGIERGDGFTGVMAGRGGQQIAPEELPDRERPHAWAARFVAAYANADGDTTLALLGASLANDDTHPQDIAALIGMAGDCLRDYPNSVRS